MTSGWQDFPQGKVVTTAAITVTETHLVQFSGLTGDFYPVHTDAEWAAKSAFGQRIAHGPLTFALAVGQMYQSQAYGNAIIAWLGADNVRATNPVFIGDTIHVKAEVLTSRQAKNPDRGIVTLKYNVINQNNDVVMEAQLAMLMRARPAEEAHQTLAG
ncbi:MAG: hypothetical protein C0606_16390 [Hyphomicrobiales bacterium]|nr:MAG: hypothetical protein C0606_16390 [Hyphomicrobiales bacterium]